MKKNNEINYWEIYPTRMWVLALIIAVTFLCFGFAALLFALKGWF